MNLAATGGRQSGGIRGLIVVKGVRIGHQQRRPSNNGDLGNRRGAGTGNHLMGRGHALRHIGEERRNLRVDAQLGIGILDPADIVSACLLGNDEPGALGIGQQGDRRRNSVGKELRALAAAEYQQTKWIAAG